jgi:hypothetical protein
VKKGMAPNEKMDREKERALLNRLVNTRLIVQEARKIGLDQLSEVAKMVDAFSKETLREELVERITRNVKADQKEVDRIHKELSREWKISAVLFETEEDAKRVEPDLRTGGDFSEQARRFLAERKARKVEAGVYVKAKDVDPELAKRASGMPVGSISPIVRAKSGVVIFKLEDTRYTENPGDKETAAQIALNAAKRKAVEAYDETLKKKYVKVRQDVLKSIDYEAQRPGFQALLKDGRVVAEIPGEKPVTVGELTEQLRYQFYHGVEMAAERKRLNARKEKVLDGLLHRKVFRKEALRLGLERTESYRGRVSAYEASVLFGTFINKVIVPEIRITEQELKAHYNSHVTDYTEPAMTRLKSLVFAKRGDAESALTKLRQGAEFQWLAAHAEGQVDRSAKGVVSFEGNPLITEELPEGVRKAIGGAKAGDARLYASPEGHFYVLAIQDVIAASPQPYDQARPRIAEQIFAEKQKKAVEDHAGRLKALSEVTVYLKD